MDEKTTVQAIKKEEPITKEKKNEKHKLTFNQWQIIFTVVLIIGAVVLFGIGFNRRIDAVRTGFNTELDETKERVYELFKAKAEEANHVSNRATINIGNTENKQSLQVLKVGRTTVVSDVEEKYDGITSWQMFIGVGTYSVDLSAAEFIVDEQNSTVFVHAPYPELSEITVEPTGQKFYADDKLLGGKYAEGVNIAHSQKKIARQRLTNEIKKQYTGVANKPAEEAIGYLVKSWNPDIKDLNVIIDFFEVERIV